MKWAVVRIPAAAEDAHKLLARVGSASKQDL